MTDTYSNEIIMYSPGKDVIGWFGGLRQGLCVIGHKVLHLNPTRQYKRMNIEGVCNDELEIHS